MFIAKSAALRTLDLSRQVGAAIFTPDGEIISLGSNEVPKAGGGTYWPDEKYDDRDYKRMYDSNDRRKKEILSEIMQALGIHRDVTSALEEKAIRDSQLMDVLEFGRIMHAEMTAICDAARLGRSIENSVLYTTAFPCHMCAKHIVGASISRVIFLEPYPKSLAAALHADSIEIEGGDRGSYRTWPAVRFEHFYGITPRRYAEFFARSGRKDRSTGEFLEYRSEPPIPFMDIKLPFYRSLEEETMKVVLERVRGVASDKFFET
jgi:deoxycytidylate deaminase